VKKLGIIDKSGRSKSLTQENRWISRVIQESIDQLVVSQQTSSLLLV